ncbi:MAG: hypothetical protein RL365_1278 [Bacteroidota bacterium]|jgi:hypothetical protein
MENFFRRLKYYGIGFGIGLVFVVLLFQQKGCSWTPGNRVKSAILERIVFIDSLDERYIKAHNISPKILRKFIENGTVSFLKSKRNGQEKLYHFHGTLGSDKSFNCLVGYREKSVVVDLDFEHSDIKQYKPLAGFAKPFLYKKKNWFSGKWNLYELKGMVPSSAPEKFTELFLKNGRLDCSKSTFDIQKPTSYLFFTNQFAKHHKQEYQMRTIWYQEKIEIKDMSIIDIRSNN